MSKTRGSHCQCASGERDLRRLAGVRGGVRGSMDPISAKIIALVLMLLLTLLFGLLPIKVARLLRAEPASLDGSVKRNRKRQYDTIISCLLCFGGGVLLSTCFIHMLPEVRESSLLAIQDPNLSFFNDFPLAELIMCFGFFFTYFIEELVHGMIRKQRKHKGTQPITGPNSDVTTPECMSQPRNEIPKDPTQSVVPTKYVSAASFDSAVEFSPPLSQRALPQTIVQRELERNDELSHTYGHHIPTTITSLRSLLVILALSFHSIFEGMALGLQETVAGVWYLFLAVCVHKFVIAFCVGLEIITKGCKIRTLVIYMCTFALMSPLGAGIGIGLMSYLTSYQATQPIVLTFLQGIASGTLMYVTFFEVLESERNKCTSGLLKLFSTVLGFVLMCLLTGFIHDDD